MSGSRSKPQKVGHGHADDKVGHGHADEKVGHDNADEKILLIKKKGYPKCVNVQTAKYRSSRKRKRLTK